MPHTIAENLQRLVDAKTAIGNAITTKGGTVGAGDGLEDFADDIASIPSGGENNATFVKGSGTFYVKSCLKEINIPAGVTALSAECFSDCIRLEKIVLNDEITLLPTLVFKSCVFSTIDLKNVTSISDRVFDGCSNLTNLEIPNSVNNISNNAFAGSSITLITIHKPEGSILGAPWGATNATVVWTG